MLRRALVVLLVTACATAAHATVYRVTKTADTNDGSCAADDCSLREAIIAANASAGPDSVTLPTGTYRLTLHGADEDACATGDLDVTDTLEITGAYSSTTIIDGDGADRVFDVRSSFLALSGVTVQNGGGVDNGGGIRSVSTGSELRLYQSTVTGNRAANMGGGLESAGTLVLTSVTVTSNDGGSFGGGLEVQGPSTLRDVTVGDNHTTYGGGGIMAMSHSNLDFARGTVSGNSSQYGGGLEADGGTCLLTNVTFDGNSATGSEGGAVLNSGGSVTVLYSTFSSNHAVQGGRSVSSRSSTATVEGSILVTDDGSPNCSGSVVSQGANLDSGTSCNFTAAGDLSATEPLLGALQSNGGPTRTRALLRGSPAIDAAASGSCPATDQRGVTRPQGPACDMGAYEADGTEPAAALPLTVPVVAHLFGLTTPWRSDLSLSNPSSAPLPLTLTYYPGSGAPISRTVTLQAQGTGLLQDVVGDTMGAGDGRGPLVISPPTTGPVPVVMSRTFAIDGAERLGQNVPAGLPLPAGTTFLPGLRQDGAYRSNVAVATAGSAVTVTFDLLRGADGVVASGVTRTVAAHQQTQWSVDALFPGMALDGVPMTVRVETSGPAFPYASVVDQTSSDAVTIAAQSPGTAWLVPVVAGNSGSGTTFWRSDASLANPGDADVTVTLELLREGRDNSSGDLTAAAMTLAAGATATIADVERTSFGVTDVKGTLRVAATGPIVLTSRTYTSREDGGTYGLGVPPVAPGALTADARMITGVRGDAPYRTNIGLLAGAGGGSAALMLFDGNGSLMATGTVDLQPFSLVQASLTALFPGTPAPVPAGSIVITALEPYIAYVSVVDGSSQDPVYEVPPVIQP